MFCFCTWSLASQQIADSCKNPQKCHEKISRENTMVIFEEYVSLIFQTDKAFHQIESMNVMRFSWIGTFFLFYCRNWISNNFQFSYTLSKCILTEILSLAKNYIGRNISLDEIDIDRNIFVTEHYIDREGQKQDKNRLKYFILFTKPLSATASIPPLWLKMVLTELFGWKW